MKICFQPVGPFKEGDPLTIMCVATGGEPPPSVLWYKENQIIDRWEELINRQTDNQKTNRDNRETNKQTNPLQVSFCTRRQLKTIINRLTDIQTNRDSRETNKQKAPSKCPLVQGKPNYKQTNRQIDRQMEIQKRQTSKQALSKYDKPI